MAQLDGNGISGLSLGSHKQIHNPQIKQIQTMLGSHDLDCKISQQINQCIIDTGIPLEVLSQFDEKSLAETIDSWKINTFGKQMFLIRGLLISGIKKNTPKAVLSENEIKMMDQLIKFEKIIFNKLESFENESKTNKEMKENSLKMYQTQIESAFEDIISILIHRKKILLNKLQKLFDKREKEETDYISYLKSTQNKISNLKQVYKNNTSKYSEMDEITKRSEKNCQMINTFLNTHDHANMYTLQKCDYSCDVTFGKESITKLKIRTSLLGSVRPIGRILQVETIDNVKKLEANIVHRFDVLQISDKGILTVQGWDKETGKGGKLLLHCNKLIIENGGCINVDGKGYKGGDNTHPQGYSIGNNNLLYGRESNELLNKSNNGGGGMGFARFGHGGWGGGGGYGTDGKCGQGVGKIFYVTNNDHGIVYGEGGDSYGSEKLFEVNGNNVQLGSGGGAGSDLIKWYNGGNGGGAIVIECEDAIVIKKGAIITANGDVGDYGGCGSGGSIYLKTPMLVNCGKINAVGGKGQYGSGGVGRIRVDCDHGEMNIRRNFEPNNVYNGLLMK